MSSLLTACKEIYQATEIILYYAPKVWDKLMDAGKDDGLIPAGFAALDKLRIEAGLILFGNKEELKAISENIFSNTSNFNLD